MPIFFCTLGPFTHMQVLGLEIDLISESGYLACKHKMWPSGL